MKTIVKENTWLPGLNHGWGNGYVVIPEGHPLYGINYNDIDVKVHYGLTFGELITPEFEECWPELTKEDIGCWVVGFDTCHCSDNMTNWTKEAVEAETESLKNQILEYINSEPC